MWQTAGQILPFIGKKVRHILRQDGRYLQLSGTPGDTVKLTLGKLVVLDLLAVSTKCTQILTERGLHITRRQLSPLGQLCWASVREQCSQSY